MGQVTPFFLARQFILLSISNLKGINFLSKGYKNSVLKNALKNGIVLSLVIGEGAATLILENYEHALARGAPIYAEVVGFGTNTDGNHVTQPTAETMEQALRLALQDAHLRPQDIGFVNGHGTATEHGDIAETLATYHISGQNPHPLFKELFWSYSWCVWIDGSLAWH